MNRASFQTRARVIELLGKEQIADAATALSELLKNAIDAFAVDAQVKFSTRHQLLQVADNGLGMRTSDLLDRWLVVATESKRLPMDPSWLTYASDEQRQQARQYPPLGQKGIGRLAAATLGSGALIWTCWGEEKDFQRTLLLIHWGLFEHPTLRLDEIIIPYLSFQSDTATGADARALAMELRNWLASSEQDNKWRLEVETSFVKPSTSEYEREIREVSRELRTRRREIIEDIDNNFLPALSDELEFTSSPGTVFTILSPTDQTREIFDFPLKLNAQAASAQQNSAPELNSRIDPKIAPEELRNLLGFSDPFGEIRPRIQVKLENDEDDISSLFDFWTPEDFTIADHEIDVSVDWAGVATGTIRRYDEIFEYEYHPLGDLPKFHRYPGPFRMHIGYIPGSGDTRLQPEEFVRMDKRLMAFGALYVYRDGIRVLPYGRSDNDFLGLEERRTRHVGRNFFSHRRMFGGVYIDTKNNSELKDKAGREGFIKNGAYRGFVKFLRDIFQDLAYRYYGTDAVSSYEAGIFPTSPSREAADLLREKSRAGVEEFTRTLPEWRKQLTDAENDFESEFTTAENLLVQIEKLNVPSVEALQHVERFLDRLRRDVNENLDDLGTDPPAIAPIPESARTSFDTYLSERQQYEINTAASIGSLAQRYEHVAQRLLPENVRTENIKARIASTQQECTLRIERGFYEFTQACAAGMEELAPKWKEQQLSSLQDLMASLGPDPVAAIISDSTGKLFSTLEITLSQQLARTREVFVPFWTVAASQVRSLETGEGGDVAIGTLMRTLEKLEERGHMLSELAQLGLIVEAVDHDYHVLFRNLGDELSSLLNIVKDKPEAGELISRISRRLNSIDQKARLLSPVYRKEPGTRETLSGSEVKEFLDALFTDDQRGQLEIEYSARFLEMRLPEVYKPVVLAATANLVENSIYWTSRGTPPRRVRFTVTPHGFVVSDSGPGIAPRDRERVFDPYFTRKPYGRGLGLYITRTNLEAKGTQINVAAEPQRGALTGANFIITKRTSE